MLISVSVPFKVTSKGELSPPLVQYPSKMKLIESLFFDEQSVFKALFRLNVIFLHFANMFPDAISLVFRKRYLNCCNLGSSWKIFNVHFALDRIFNRKKNYGFECTGICAYKPYL